MKKRILALLLSLSLMVSVVVPGTVAMDGGDTVNDTYTELAVNGRETLHASQFGISAEPYQWQISIGGTWINISGETSDSITVSYAMLCNALSGDTAQVRCVGYDSEGMLIESDAMTIRITEEVAPTPVEQEETHPAGTVLEQAKPLGDPIIEKIEGESENIKDQIKEKFDEFKDNAKDALDQIKDSAKEKLEELKNKIDEKNDPEPIDQTEETSAETTAPAETSAEPASTDDSAAADDSVVTGGSETTNVETDTAPTTDEDAGDDDVSDQTEMTETTGEAEPENPADSEDKTPAAEEPADTTTEQEVTTSAPETEAPVTEAPETDAPVATEPSEGSDEDETEDIVISAPSFASPLTDEEPSAENKENDTQTPPPAPAEQTPPTSPSDPVTTAAPEKQEEPTGNTENTDENQKTPENTEQKDVPSDEQNNVPTVTDSANNVQENDTPAGETTEPTTYTIRINYQFADGTPVTDPWSSDAVETGYSYKCDIKSPVVAGFMPDMETVSVDASEGVTYTVTYQPVEPELVDYTVVYYKQNLDDNDYTEIGSEELSGAVGDTVIVKKEHEGFFARIDGDRTITDGAVIRVYYDRYYYLVTPGSEKVYAKFGTEFEEQVSLYEMLMSCKTYAEIEEFIAQFGDEKCFRLYEALTAEEQSTLDAHIQTLYEEYLETLVIEDEQPAGDYSNVAFFRELLENIQSNSRLRRAPRATTQNGTDGLELTKYVNDNKDGTYTINLEAYTTGEIKTSTGVKPVDIVLLVDMSTSMRENFSDSGYVFTEIYSFNTNDSYYVQSGNRYISVEWCDKCKAWTDGCYYIFGHHNGGTKYAPKMSVDDVTVGSVQFYIRENKQGMTRLEALQQAANSFITEVAEKGGNRMAIVGFHDYSVSLTNGFLDATENEATLKNAINNINNLIPATDHDDALIAAEELFAKSEASVEERQRVVVLFTDGEPEPKNSSDWSSNTVRNAIESAYKLKNTYNAAVYCISVAPGTDAESMSSPMDKYMSYVSSNYPSAHYTGELVSKRSHEDELDYEQRVVDQVTPGEQADISDGSFYLSASSISALQSIFQQIASQTGGSSISLGSNAVIKDIVTPYFNMPKNVSDVTVKSVDCLSYNTATGDATWETTGTTLTDNVAIDGSQISVTGFDFDRNFVSENGRVEGNVSQVGNFHGRKLVISFTVTTKDGFLGGNNVPTNGDNSGVYSGADLIKQFEVPTVDITIPEVIVTAEDKNVYLLHTMTDDEYKENATATCNGVNLFDEIEYTGNNAWKAAFVDITTAITKPEGTLTADDSYKISATVAPKTNPTTENKKSDEAIAKINVFKPELTFKDDEADYGANVPDLTNNLTSTVWKHGEMVDTKVTMTGTAPELTKSYTPDSKKISNGKINSTEDIGVTVTVKIGETNVTDYVTFIHQSCTDKDCPAELPTGTHFLIHVMTRSLTIKKEGAQGIDENQSFIFNVSGNGVNLDVVIKGNSQVTIDGLRVGTYTVTEKNWSWRYTPVENFENNKPLIDNQQSVNLEKTETVVFFNNRTESKWLNGCDYKSNIFGKSN